MQATSAPCPLALEEDYKVLSDCGILEKQGVLLHPIEEKDHGNIFFSLDHMPLAKQFKTEKGNLIQRISNSEVILFTPDRGSVSKIIVKENNEEFSLFSSPSRLISEGVMLFDTQTEAGKVLFQLIDIPLEKEYRTEKGTPVKRISENIVKLGGQLIVLNDTKSKLKQIEEKTTPTIQTNKLVDSKPSNEASVIDFSCVQSLQFEAMMKVLGGKMCKRTIVLNKEKLKIRRKNKTVAKEKHGYVVALADVHDPRQFTLVIKKKSYHFVAVTTLQRNEILSAIRTMGGDKKLRD